MRHLLSFIGVEPQLLAADSAEMRMKEIGSGVLHCGQDSMTGEPHFWQKAGTLSRCRKTETHATFVHSHILP